MSLEKLKELRKRRMERATVDLQNSKDYLLFCQRELEEKYNEVGDYKQWSLKHREELFGGLQSSIFAPEDLGEYLQDLERMKLRRKQLEDELENAKMKYQEAEIRVQEKQYALSLIMKKLEKLTEIIKMEKEGLASIEDRKEEDVVDEIVAFRASA